MSDKEPTPAPPAAPASPTTSSFIDEFVKTYTSPEEAKQHWSDILVAVEKKYQRKASRTLVNKRVRKLYSAGFWRPEGEEPSLPEAVEPIIKMETPEKRPIIEEPEPEKPERLPEPKPLVTPEGEAEAAPTAEGELSEEEISKLRPILVRGIKRTFGVVTEGLMKLSEDAGLTEQEADDSIIILEIGLLKWTGTSMRKYYLETTAVLHFGSIAGRALMAWREKRAKEDEAEKLRIQQQEKAKTDVAAAKPPAQAEPEKKSEEELTKEKPYRGDPPKFLTPT